VAAHRLLVRALHGEAPTSDWPLPFAAPTAPPRP
jgi:hypothetical protein